MLASQPASLQGCAGAEEFSLECLGLPYLAFRAQRAPTSVVKLVWVHSLLSQPGRDLCLARVYLPWIYAIMIAVHVKT